MAVKYFLKSFNNQHFTIIFDPVKRPLAIIFIFLLSAQCVFKLGIIAYFQANRDYIAEVLCINREKEITMCYGQCFLDRNLAIADESAADQAPATSKLQVETSIFIATSFEFGLTRYFCREHKVSAPQPLYAFDPAHSLFHPPC